MNLDLYNHGTLRVASDKPTVSLGNVLGDLEGWDTLLTTGFNPPPPSQHIQTHISTTGRQRSKGEILTLIRALGKYKHWLGKKRIKVHSY